MNVLNLNGQIIWVFVNLLILFLLMKKFLFGPITRMLDARSKGVSDTLDQADARLAEAEQSKQEYDKQLADARSQAAQIIAESRKRADLAYSRRMEEAKMLLKMTDYKSHVIGTMVGYPEPNYFSYVFKKHCAISPVKYRTLGGENN